MKKSIKTIGAITVVGAMIIYAYLLGTTQDKTIMEVPARYIDINSNNFCNNYIDMRQVTDFVATDSGLQL